MQWDGESPPMPSGQVVRLNVGGKRFQTTAATLLRCRDSFFTALLSGHVPSTIDDDGAYFIDRNGSLFEPILDFMRSGTLVVPPFATARQLVAEGQFYCIDLATAVCPIREGVYVSMSGEGAKHPWIVAVQQHDLYGPDMVGITGVIDEAVLFDVVCPVHAGRVTLKHGPIHVVLTCGVASSSLRRRLEQSALKSLTRSQSSAASGDADGGGFGSGVVSPRSGATSPVSPTLPTHASLAWQSSSNSMSPMSTATGGVHSNSGGGGGGVSDGSGFSGESAPLVSGETPMLVALDGRVFGAVRNLIWKGPLSEEFPLPLGHVWTASRQQFRFERNVDIEQRDSTWLRITSRGGLSSLYKVRTISDTLVLFGTSSRPVGLIFLSGTVPMLIRTGDKGQFVVLGLRRQPQGHEVQAVALTEGPLPGGMGVVQHHANPVATDDGDDNDDVEGGNV